MILNLFLFLWQPECSVDVGWRFSEADSDFIKYFCFKKEDVSNFCQVSSQIVLVFGLNTLLCSFLLISVSIARKVQIDEAQLWYFMHKKTATGFN